jgi:cytochrome c-type biogenesis protein CcmE
MSLLPRSRTARRRLMVLAVAAPVLALAVGAAIYGSQNAITYFYTPSQARAAHVPPGRQIQLGGLVRLGSVVDKPSGEVDFVVVDYHASSPVVFLPVQGPMPELFREGQGAVAIGAYDATGVFRAVKVLAKHDEKYQPPELTAALKKEAGLPGAAAP